MGNIDYLVVGLGNPGEEYANTPHNLGFMVVDRLAESNSIRVSRKENMSLVGLGGVAGKRIGLAKPQTYMNLSGPSVKGLLERYELQPDRLIVVYDELDLPWGSLRIRLRGSAAGHNGMKSIISSLGMNEFTRVRIGAWPTNQTGGRDAAKFVLAPFKRAQKQEVEDTVRLAAEAVESIIAEGAEKAMTKYNAHKRDDDAHRRQSVMREEDRRAQGLNTEEE